MNGTIATPISVTRNELYALIWAEPMTKVAPRFGLSDVGLAKVCKRYEIPRPPVGYWAQKHVGKEPPQTPLPPAEDESWQTIEFSSEEIVKPVVVLTAADRVADEQLKKLIEFEERPENRIAVNDDPSKYHPVVRKTKASFSERYADRQGLHSPSWSEGACLDIHVTKESLPRALRFMDALIKAVEQRGHKVMAEGKELRKQVQFLVLGEKLGFRLREKTKMVRIPESERDSPYGPRVKYDPTGLFELQLSRSLTGFAEVTWKDSNRAKLENHLNGIVIELIVTVEKERHWRRQQEENERQRRENEIKRWQQEQERRKEEQKIAELDQMVQNWSHAARIRDFIGDVRFTIEGRKGPIAEGSDLAQWIHWALTHADTIDPLGVRRTDGAVVDNNSTRPNQPR